MEIEDLIERIEQTVSALEEKEITEENHLAASNDLREMIADLYSTMKLLFEQVKEKQDKSDKFMKRFNKKKKDAKNIYS